LIVRTTVIVAGALGVLGVGALGVGAGPLGVLGVGALAAGAGASLAAGLFSLSRAEWPGW